MYYIFNLYFSIKKIIKKMKIKIVHEKKYSTTIKKPILVWEIITNIKNIYLLLNKKNFFI